VHFTEEGVFDWCFLQENTEIQGLLCSGDGHGFQTTFHPNGQLKTAYLVKDQSVQQIPCAKFRFLSAVFNPIHGKNGNTSFHENGQLRYCELSENFTIDGERFKRGDALRFDPKGALIEMR
jgi:antitoxin component YwqK of YwqJK toxin-antitoxin module